MFKWFSKNIPWLLVHQCSSLGKNWFNFPVAARRKWSAACKMFQIPVVCPIFCPYLNRQDFEPPCHLCQNDHWIFTAFEKTFYGNCSVHGSSAAVLALIFPGSSDWQQHDTSSFIWRLNANVSDIQYQSCCWANDGAAKRSDEQRELVKWIFLGNIPNRGGKKEKHQACLSVCLDGAIWVDVFSDRSFFFW